MKNHLLLKTGLLALLLCALHATPLSAQLSATVPVGSVVRWSQDGGNRSGTVTTVDDTAEVLWVRRRRGEEPVAVALGTSDLALRIKSNQKVAAAGIGFLAGFGLGVASGDDEGGLFAFSAEAKGAMLGGSLALLGMAVGQSAEWALLVGPAGNEASVNAPIASSQLSSTFMPGRLVRWRDADGRHQATVVSVDDSEAALVVRQLGGVATEQIVLATPGLEMRTGTGHKLLAGGIGAGIGLMVAFAVGEDPTPPFVASYALLGWLLGPGDQWTPLHTVTRPSATISALLEPGRVGVRVAY